MTKQLVPMEAAWIAVVRAALPADLKGLCLAPDDWYDGMDESSAEGRCLAWFDLVADECVVLTVGAYFDGVRTTVGSLHNQLFSLESNRPTFPPQTFTGSITDQAVKACDLLAAIRRRPVERHDWSRTVHEYRFADDGTGLVASGSTPSGHEDRHDAGLTGRVCAPGPPATPESVI